jgi:broad specificity phosphatase PhoE
MTTSPSPTALTTTIHLVRHGEVENPAGVIYGRLPGYHLSERGRAQVSATAQRLRDADVGAIRSSPLERAQETAAIIAEQHGIEVVTDDRLTESDTTFEGAARSLLKFLRTPRHWWGFRNPLRPSWGESFEEVGARMVAAVADAVAEAREREVVVVSHQTPVRVARLALARRRVPPWLPLTRCSTGSVTTLVFRDGTVVAASYFEPSA